MKKRKKKTPVKKLQDKCEALWKKICLAKYGKYCHVQKLYPEINITHSDVIQVDHCITRGNKYFFFDTNNGTPVCGNCNLAKCYDNKSVSRAIDEIVENRNPQWFKDAVWLDKTGEPNTNFSRIWWLEEKLKDLEEEWKQLD